MKTKIKIKSVFGKVLFEYEKEDNTIKETVVKAVDSGADLGDADLRGADLRGADLRGAYLGGADLGGAYLRGAYLGGADLGGADLGGADLGGADLGGADLRGADLGGAYLRGAYLRGAYLRGAYLRGAYLRGAYLGGADLGGADLGGADLRGADINKWKHQIWIIPEEGSFVAWKKCVDAIVKIEIPAKAKRTCNFINRKCRASYVKTLEIYNIDGTPSDKREAIGRHDDKTVYKVGRLTHADKFDDDLRVDCTNGIHFFVTKQEAMDW